MKLSDKQLADNKQFAESENISKLNDLGLCSLIQSTRRESGQRPTEAVKESKWYTTKANKRFKLPHKDYNTTTEVEKTEDCFSTNPHKNKTKVPTYGDIKEREFPKLEDLDNTLSEDDYDKTECLIRPFHRRSISVFDILSTMESPTDSLLQMDDYDEFDDIDALECDL